MLCQACHGPAEGVVCPPCRAGFTRSGEKVLPGGVRLVTAFEHHGAPARMVQDLKYRGVLTYVELVAEVLAGLVPPVPLVPVPRSWARLIQYGVDPARQIALGVAARNGAKVVDALIRPVHTRRRARGDHSTPARPFRARPVPGPVVLVDDVVTTGATLASAIAALGVDRVQMAIAANDATTRSTLAPDDL